jgi:hypothetical protein
MRSGSVVSVGCATDSSPGKQIHDFIKYIVDNVKYLPRAQLRQPDTGKRSNTSERDDTAAPEPVDAINLQRAQPR